MSFAQIRQIPALLQQPPSTRYLITADRRTPVALRFSGMEFALSPSGTAIDTRCGGDARNLARFIDFWEGGLQRVRETLSAFGTPESRRWQAGLQQLLQTRYGGHPFSVRCPRRCERFMEGPTLNANVRAHWLDTAYSWLNGLGRSPIWNRPGTAGEGWGPNENADGIFIVIPFNRAEEIDFQLVTGQTPALALILHEISHLMMQQGHVSVRTSPLIRDAVYLMGDCAAQDPRARASRLSCAILRLGQPNSVGPGYGTALAQSLPPSIIGTESFLLVLHAVWNISVSAQGLSLGAQLLYEYGSEQLRIAQSDPAQGTLRAASSLMPMTAAANLTPHPNLQQEYQRGVLAGAAFFRQEGLLQVSQLLGSHLAFSISRVPLRGSPIPLRNVVGELMRLPPHFRAGFSIPQEALRAYASGLTRTDPSFEALLQASLNPAGEFRPCPGN